MVGPERFKITAPETEEKTDPLKKQHKTAEKITDNLSVYNGKLRMVVLGALHNGIIGQDIKTLVEESDVVSFELPSQVVTQKKQGIDGKSISDNIFWQAVLDLAIEQQRLIIGSNNNRAAVNGIRILENRIRKEQKPFENGPHAVVSIDEKDQATFKNLRNSELKKPILVEAKKEELQGIFKGAFDNINFPFHLRGEGEAEFTHFSQMRSFDETKTPQLLLSFYPWSTPIHFFNKESLERMESLGNFYEVPHNFVSFFLQHLIRVRVDRTQVDGFISQIDKYIKYRISNREKEGEIMATHIGGETHNPNIVGMLENLFGRSDVVQIEDRRDQRALPIGSEGLTFFGDKINVVEALAATEVFSDQILINVPRAKEILDRITVEYKEEIKALSLRESIVEKYIDTIVEFDNSVQFEVFALHYILSLLPKETLEFLNITPKFSFRLLKDAVKMSIEKDPGKGKEVERALELVGKRRKNFPNKT